MVSRNINQSHTMKGRFLNFVQSMFDFIPKIKQNWRKNRKSEHACLWACGRWKVAWVSEPCERLNTQRFTVLLQRRPRFLLALNQGHCNKYNARMRSFSFFFASAFPKGLPTWRDGWQPVTRIGKPTPRRLGSRVLHVMPRALPWWALLVMGPGLRAPRTDTQARKRRASILHHSSSKGKEKRREEAPSMMESWLITSLDSDKNVKNREGKKEKRKQIKQLYSLPHRK